MEKIKVVCSNCGSEVETDKFSVAVFCKTCGGKIVVKRDKNDESAEFDRKKLLLRKAFETREITDIIVRAKDVIEMSPNDFFANFLYAYCLLRRGNNNSMLNFFAKAEVSSASEEEMDIVLSEITKTRNYYDRKKAFIERAENSGFNILKYADYIKPEEQAKPKENSDLYFAAAKSLDKNCAVFYIAFLAFILFISLIINFINGNFDPYMLVVFVLGTIFTVAITVMSGYFGFNAVMVLITLIFTFGIYLIIRMVAAYSVYSRCLREGGNGITYQSLFMHGKL